ncbi:MAG: carboxypeptidase regulatory-like domain-containing protein [Gemmatimonadota bacterium]
MRERDLFTGLVLPLTLAGVLAGCGGADDDAGGPAEDTAAEMPFDVATAGHVQGMVMFEGAPPAPVTLDMASEPECDAHWNGETEVEEVRVRDGHLAQVFVYVKEGLEGMEFPIPGEAVLIDQEGCTYEPHVSGVMTGQTLTFRNSDPLMHNINGSPQVNRPFNFSQPAQGMESNRTLAQQEVMVPVQCDVHGWMHAYIGVVSHPYYAATGDPGTFDLRDLPPGDYVIEAWHPRLGTQEQQVTVETGQTAEVAFTFTEAMLETAVVPLGEPIDPHSHHTHVQFVGSDPAPHGPDQGHASGTR